MATFQRRSSIIEVLQKCPEAVDIFARHGLNCFECMGADVETIEDGALMHGLDIDSLLKDLNDSCRCE